MHVDHVSCKVLGDHDVDVDALSDDDEEHDVEAILCGSLSSC